jgi:hypothetical protein
MLPDPPGLEKATDPVGQYPATLAVQTVDEPTATVAGTQATARLLVAGSTITGSV